MVGSRLLTNIVDEVDELINQSVVLDTHIIQTKIDGYNVGYDTGLKSDPAYVSNNSFPEDGIYHTRQLWYDKKIHKISLTEPKARLGFRLKRATGRQKNELYAFEVELKNKRVAKMKIIKLNKLNKTMIGLLLNVHNEQKVK